MSRIPRIRSPRQRARFCSCPPDPGTALQAAAISFGVFVTLLSLKPDETNSPDSSNPSSLGQPGIPVCWTSSDKESLSSIATGIPGVSVFGSGCRDCVVGATCSFSITVFPPAQWTAASDVSERREFNVIIAGPSLHAGAVGPSETPSDDSVFRVTYRIWDEGVYRASLRSSCGSLNYTTGDVQRTAHEMASWELRVHSVRESVQLPQEPQDLRGESTNSIALDEMLVVDQLMASHSIAAAALSCPCAVGRYGRWLIHPDGLYQWVPYECNEYRDLQLDGWIAALNTKGIHEISFVGDSHQRMLMLHLRSLLTGGQLYTPHKQLHGNFAYHIPAQKGLGSLQLNFYWMSGIYVANTELGCSKADRQTDEPTFPVISPMTDVLFVEAGYWTGDQCRHPEAALATYFPPFMAWAADTVKNLSQQALSYGKARGPRFLYRPTPPRVTETKGCDGNLLTNKYVRTANTIERLLVPRFNASTFYSWEIEAGRFTDNCPHDHHYSCAVRRDGDSGNWTVAGVVGEAVATALIHTLLHF